MWNSLRSLITAHFLLGILLLKDGEPLFAICGLSAYKAQKEMLRYSKHKFSCFTFKLEGKKGNDFSHHITEIYSYFDCIYNRRI